MKVKQLTCEDYENCFRGINTPYYSGTITQRGYGLGGLLRGLTSHIIPLLPRIGKSLLKSAGTTALGVASDRFKGVPLSKSLKNRGLQESKKILESLVQNKTNKYSNLKRSNKYGRISNRGLKRKRDVLGAI